LSPFVALVTSPLMRTIMFGTISAITIEWFINAHLRRMGLNDGQLIGLGTTEIPFYPISSNLTTYRERTEEHATVGHGVRLSGTAPPMAPAFRLDGNLIVDGAFIANVPSRYLREIGADFVIAANAVPPAPSESPKSGTLGQLVGFAMTRFNDAMRANQLLTWKAGEDQANLHADYRCDLRPKDSNVIDMWKGRAISEQIRRDHFSGPKSTAIRDAWKIFCKDPSSPRDNADEPDAGDGSIRGTRRRTAR
jgi:predicted acylesterase/phospholipase RssA